MTAREDQLRGLASPGLDLDLVDMLRTALSSLAERLGLGWGLFLGLVVPTLVVVLVGMAGTVWLWRRTRRNPSSSTGSDIFPGRIVTVRSADGTQGQTFVEGGWWSLHSTGEPLRAGEQVRIRAVEGLVLVVEPLTPEAPNEEDT